MAFSVNDIIRAQELVLIQEIAMKKKNKHESIAAIISICVIFSLFGLIVARVGSVNAQDPVFQTPTPDAEGNVYHTVTAEDFACWNIAEKYKIDVKDLIRLNSNILGDDCVIYPGMKLLVAVITATAIPPTSTPIPEQPTVPPQEEQPTQPPVVIEPEPTAMLDTGKICIVLFHDLDGNGMRTDGESYLYGGEVSINDRIGTVSRVGTTVAGDPETTKPMCFEQLPPGEYNISIAVPDGFNSTTATTHALSVVSGETLTIDFGAQEATPASTEQDAVANSKILPVFFIGLGILLLGIGLLIYMLRSRRA
jgi:LysM repeat protein